MPFTTVIHVFCYLLLKIFPTGKVMQILVLLACERTAAQTAGLSISRHNCKISVKTKWKPRSPGLYDPVLLPLEHTGFLKPLNIDQSNIQV